MRRVLSLLLLLGALGCAHAATVERAGDAIVFEGRIDAAAAARFAELAQDPAITRVIITSPGGLVGPALDIATLLHEGGLDVEVPTQCLSSCANYIFPAGKRKTLGHATAVGWHGNMAHVLYLQRTGQASWPAQAMEEAQALERRESAFYQRVGVDGFVAWFGKLPPYSVKDSYALSVTDLVRFGIRDASVVDPLSRVPTDESVVLIRVDPKQLDALRALERN